MTTDVYLSAGSNACRVYNGGCSSLCLAIPGGRQCACADDQMLDPTDNTSCKGVCVVLCVCERKLYFSHHKRCLGYIFFYIIYPSWPQLALFHIHFCLLCFSLHSQPVLCTPSSVPAWGVCLQKQPMHPGALEVRWRQWLSGQQRWGSWAVSWVTTHTRAHTF